MNKVASTFLGCNGRKNNPHTSKRCTRHNLHDTIAIINKPSTAYANKDDARCMYDKWIDATAAPHNLIQ